MEPYGFGERLQQVRRARGWTQVELGRRSGLHAMVISRLERQEKKDVTGATLRKIAKALGVSADYLLGLIPEDSESEEVPAGLELVDA